VIEAKIRVFQQYLRIPAVGVDLNRTVAVGVGILFEPPDDVGLEVRLIALGIEQRASLKT
jgi:hypothetical protein